MFGARYYGSRLGRFMTPDWAAKPVTVPYAHFGNPQSLNLYSYVQNTQPLSVILTVTALRPKSGVGRLEYASTCTFKPKPSMSWGRGTTVALPQMIQRPLTGPSFSS